MPTNKKLSKGQKKKAQARRKREREAKQELFQDRQTAIKNRVDELTGPQSTQQQFNDAWIQANQELGVGQPHSYEYEIFKHKKLIESNQKEKNDKMAYGMMAMMFPDHPDMEKVGDFVKHSVNRSDCMIQWSTIMVDCFEAYIRFAESPTKEDCLILKGIHERLMEVMYQLDESLAGLVQHGIITEDQYNVQIKSMNQEAQHWKKFQMLNEKKELIFDP